MRVLTQFTSHFPPTLLDCLNAKGPQAAPQASPLLFQKYIHPIITKADHKATMDNYRAYIKALKNEVEAFNISIVSYNKEVENNRINNPPITSKQTLIGLFDKKWSATSDIDFNAAARSFNELHGHHRTLRRLMPIRANLLLTFEAMLHAYSVHLRRTTNIRRSTYQKHLQPLPKAPINPQEIVTQQRNGIPNLEICKRSVRTHKRKFEHAGVLVEREFHGSNVCVNYFFNPSILVVSESFCAETQNTRKQALIQKKRKDLQDNQSSFTRTSENNPEIIGNVNKSHSDIRNAPSGLEDNIVFYLNTEGQDCKKNKPTASKKTQTSGEKFKKMQTSGEILAGMQIGSDTAPPRIQTLIEKEVDNMDSRRELAAKLSHGVYNNYVPLAIKDLNKEINSPNITNEDFRELVLHDFIKCAGAINKKDQAGPGSWNLAIQFIDSDFGCRNFKGTAGSKIDIISKLISFKYRLRRVLGCFEKRPDWSPRYANVYFNPVLKDSRQVGWQFTARWWTKEQDRRQEIADNKKRLASKLTDQKIKLKDRSKFDQKLTRRIWAYLRSEITFSSLQEYVATLPMEQIEKFPARFETLKLKSFTKI